MTCRISGCRNRARYHIRQHDGTWLLLYCGLHDTRGRGKRAIDLGPDDQVTGIFPDYQHESC